MKTLLAGAAALALLTPALAMAQTVDGTWKAVLDSAKTPKKPEVYVIKDGMLAEAGTHAELIERPDGVYRTLSELQFDLADLDGSLASDNLSS